MSKSTKSKKRDKNRFRKVYPFLRRKPINEYVLDKSTTIEIGEVTFNDASSGSYTFSEIYDAVPNITAIAVDTESNDTANVNVFISEISQTSVTFKSSNKFTGKVHFHIIYIDETS